MDSLTGSVEGRWGKAVSGIRIHKSGDSHFASLMMEIVVKLLMVRHHRHIHDNGSGSGGCGRPSARLSLGVDGGRDELPLRGGGSLRRRPGTLARAAVFR